LFFVVSSLNPFKGIIAFEYVGHSGVIRIGSKCAVHCLGDSDTTTSGFACISYAGGDEVIFVAK
jgi:hypothetical protein